MGKMQSTQLLNDPKVQQLQEHLGIKYCANSKETKAQIKQSNMAYELTFYLGTLIEYIMFQVTRFSFKVSIILIP